MTRWPKIGNGHRPALPADELRRRRLEAWIIAITGTIFLAYTLLETRLGHFSSSGSPSSNIIFFLLINLNVLLLVLLVFLVTRNIFKLALERRRGIFGSRLRTRLVLAFVSLTLAPSILLFLVAQGFLTTAFDTWFNVRVDEALRGSLEVSQSYYQFAANNALHFAQEVARQTQPKLPVSPQRRSDLQDYVQRKRVEFGLVGLEIFGKDGASLARAEDPNVAGLPAPPNEAMLRLRNGKEFAETQRFGKADVVSAGVAIRDSTEAVLGGVVVAYLVPRSVSQEARTIARSYNEYRQLAGLKQPIKNGYVLTLALITLVVVFSATWFGIRQAKSITTPLQQLAEGTREVAQGNWAHRIEAPADEDTAVLVDSFNQMTAELEQINSELVKRRKYLERVLANIAAGVVSLDETGGVTMLNRAAERMLGLRLAQIRNENWRDAFARSDLRKVSEVIAEIVQYPDREVERQIKLTGGEQIVTALVAATSLTDDNGVQRGIMLFLEDVTHLLRVQRMEAWREVARRLAHEIKNPLTPIQLSAQRLQKRYLHQLPAAERDVFDECTTTIVRQVDEVKNLVNEFSSFARLPSAALMPNDLNGVVEEALRLYRQAHPDIHFNCEMAKQLPTIEFDREAIKRVLINLLDNAVAACRSMPQPAAEGSSIDVETSYLAPRGVVRLEVADNGPGMTREVKLRLFEPYFSTKRDGTGLGLAIVSSILSDHQAYIRVLDNQPRGSRFQIDFPLRQEQPVRTASRT